MSRKTDFAQTIKQLSKDFCEFHITGKERIWQHLRRIGEVLGSQAFVSLTVTKDTSTEKNEKPLISEHYEFTGPLTFEADSFPWRLNVHTMQEAEYYGIRGKLAAEISLCPQKLVYIRKPEPAVMILNTIEDVLSGRSIRTGFKIDRNINDKMTLTFDCQKGANPVLICANGAEYWSNEQLRDNAFFLTTGQYELEHIVVDKTKGI